MAERVFAGWSGIALRKAGLRWASRLCPEVEGSPDVACLEKHFEMKSAAVSSL